MVVSGEGVGSRLMPFWTGRIFFFFNNFITLIFFKMLSIFTTDCHEHFTGPFGNLNIYKLKLFLQVKNPQVARVIIST